MADTVVIAAWTFTLSVTAVVGYIDARLDGAPPVRRVPWTLVLRALTAALTARVLAWVDSVRDDASDGQAANRILSFALSFGLLVRAAVWIAVAAIWMRWEGIDRPMSEFLLGHDLRRSPLDLPYYVATSARLVSMWAGLSLVVLVGTDVRWGGPWWVTPAARAYLAAQVGVLVLDPMQSLRGWLTKQVTQFSQY